VHLDAEYDVRPGLIVFTSCRPAATLRVWSPEGCTLEHVGDADADEAQGLVAMAAWQPNGRNIYCVQSMGPKTRISIFERNGLGHGSFLVSTQEELEILQLAWSPDSSVLALSGTGEVLNNCSPLLSPTFIEKKQKIVLL
jgi:hypothetical protein